MKKIIILLIICNSISCSISSQKKEISIKGNWYSFSEPVKDESGEIFINYIELYVDESRIYHCTESMGIISPRKYHVTNDSLFVFDVKLDPSSFIGIIDTVTKSHFSVTAGDITKFYYKVLEDNILEDYIVQEEISREDYYKAFRIRLNEQQEKVSNY